MNDETTGSAQLENGYTKIANQLVDALAGIRIPGEARQCLDVIIRKTYGFNKKEDHISLSQFETITHLGKSHICRNLNKLADMRIIITHKGNGETTSYRLNKDYRLWKPLPKRVIVTHKGNTSLPNRVHTKETNTKERVYRKKFIPPLFEEFSEYCVSKGYGSLARKAFDYYAEAGWHDGKGQPVLNWKQKLISVWFREDNKDRIEKPNKPINRKELYG